MKIGFIVSFFDFRNDIRRVIEELSKSYDVVVFGLQRDEATIQAHLPQEVSFRIIDEYNLSIRNWFWPRFYHYCRKIPRSKQNFYFTELLKASNVKGNSKRKALLAYRLLQNTPKFLDYDFYLNKLQYTGKTFIDDIDHFFCFTEISNDFFFKRLLDSGKPVKVYVYSWDHPCKHTRFSKRVQYLCWNDDLKKDLVELHGLPGKHINPIGASQFTYIYDFLNTSEKELTNHFPFEYIYFGCALGIESLVPHEIAIIKQVARLMTKKLPNMKLVVRPYPVLKNWALYQSLQEIENIVLDDSFRNKDLSIADQHIFEKFEKIHFAKAFLHLGTTMGLEACFTQTPSFLIDFDHPSKSRLSIYNIVHQYHSEKHLISLSTDNHVSSLEQLAQIFSTIADSRFLVLNQKVAEKQPIKSVGQFAEDFIHM